MGRKSIGGAGWGFFLGRCRAFPFAFAGALLRSMRRCIDADAETIPIPPSVSSRVGSEEGENHVRFINSQLTRLRKFRTSFPYFSSPFPLFPFAYFIFQPNHPWYCESLVPSPFLPPLPFPGPPLPFRHLPFAICHRCHPYRCHRVTMFHGKCPWAPFWFLF